MQWVSNAKGVLLSLRCRSILMCISNEGSDDGSVDRGGGRARTPRRPPPAARCRATAPYSQQGCRRNGRVGEPSSVGGRRAVDRRAHTHARRRRTKHARVARAHDRYGTPVHRVVMPEKAHRANTRRCAHAAGWPRRAVVARVVKVSKVVCRRRGKGSEKRRGRARAGGGWGWWRSLRVRCGAWIAAPSRSP